MYAKLSWVAGGCSAASDSIWHEVVRLRLSGKLVVVSMGNYAASGGYLISGLLLFALHIEPTSASCSFCNTVCPEPMCC